MNYTTLSVINSTPRERTLSDSHNLSSLFITKFRSSQDDLLMGVLAKCAAKPQASSEDHCRQMDTGDISPTGHSTHRNVKSDRKIKLSFSVDRLLGNDIDSTSADDDADDRTVGPMMINRINCSLDDCNNCCNCSACPGGFECCKYPHGRSLYVGNVGSHGIRSAGGDSISVVRPMPIRVTNRINTASLATSVSTTFGGIAQLLKYQGPGVSSCVSSLKPLQTPSQQFRQENGMIHNNSNNNPSGQSGKRKRSWSRAVFSNLQRKGLEIQFQQQKYITKPDRRKLAARLNLTDAQVKVWFQNRRMKWRHTRENLKSGQEKTIEDLSKSNDEAMSTSEDEIDVVTE